MDTEQGKGRMALAGTVILVFGGFLGTLGTIAVESVVESIEREAIELAKRRTEVYLNFIRFKNDRLRYSGRIKYYVRSFDKPEEPAKESEDPAKEFDTSNECTKLEKHEKSKWSEDQIRIVRDLCKEWRDARRSEYDTRDKLVLYGSSGVLKALATNEREIYRRSKLGKDDEEAGVLSANSYAELLLAMRKDGIEEDKDEIKIRDILAAICGQADPCLGYKEPSYLKDD